MFCSWLGIANVCCLGMSTASLASGQNSLLSHPLHQLDGIPSFSPAPVFPLLMKGAMFQLHVPIALSHISSATIY